MAWKWVMTRSGGANRRTTMGLVALSETRRWATTWLEECHQGRHQICRLLFLLHRHLFLFLHRQLRGWGREHLLGATNWRGHDLHNASASFSPTPLGLDLLE